MVFLEVPKVSNLKGYETKFISNKETLSKCKRQEYWTEKGTRFRNVVTRPLPQSVSLDEYVFTVERNISAMTYIRHRRRDEKTRKETVVPLRRTVRSTPFLLDPGVQETAGTDPCIGGEIPTPDPPLSLDNWRIGMTRS